MSRSKPPRRERSQSQEGQDRGDTGENTGAERLQKVLAAAGIGSRRDCEELIREGRVEVDRQVVTELGTKVDPLQHEIRVDGQPIRKPKRMYFAVNKPMGVVTTNFDPSGRMRVIDLVPTEQRVFPVGRLDRYSEGLILVTNDGEFANRLTHPRYGVEKTYLVRVAGEPEQASLAKLKRGIHLSDGFCQVESIKIKGKRGNSTDMIMVLNEGKNREIRRVLARVGHKVLRLKRIAVGPLKLADLPTGAWRKLLPREVEQLIADSHQQEQKAKAARPQRDQRKAQRESAPVDDEMDDAQALIGGSLADDHVAEDEELLGDDDLAGMLGDAEGDDEALLADGDFGEEVGDDYLAEMGLEDEDGEDEELVDEDDEEFEVVEISDDDLDRPGSGRQPMGDVLAYDDDDAEFDDLGDDEEVLRSMTAPRKPARGPRQGSAGPRGRGGPTGRSGTGPRGRRSESGGEERGDFASRRPGTRRKVKGEGRGGAYRGGFGSRPPREQGDEAGEGRGRRPGARRPAGRGGPGGSRFGERSGARGEGPARSAGGRPAGRAPGKRTGPGARGPGARGPGARGPGSRSAGPGGAGPGRSGPGRSGPDRGGPSRGGPGRGGPGGRPGRGGPGGRGPGAGPRGRGPGSGGTGGPRKGGPRKGGPRR